MNKLYWYIVYWRNKKFLKTKFKPNKVGSIVGAKEKGNDLCRKGIDKNGDFKIVEKYAYLGYMTKEKFKEWIKDDKV